MKAYELKRSLDRNRILLALLLMAAFLIGGCGGGTTGTGNNGSLVRNIVLVGQVLDPKGQPLENVNVLVEQSGAHDMTAADGTFVVETKVGGNNLTVQFDSDEISAKHLDLSIPEGESEVQLKIEINQNLETLTVLSISIEPLNEPTASPTASAASNQSSGAPDLMHDTQSSNHKPDNDPNGVWVTKFEGQVLQGVTPLSKARLVFFCDTSTRVKVAYAGVDSTGHFSAEIKRISTGQCDIYVYLKQARRVGYARITDIPAGVNVRIRIVLAFGEFMGSPAITPADPGTLFGDPVPAEQLSLDYSYSDKPGMN